MISQSESMADISEIVYMCALEREENPKAFFWLFHLIFSFFQAYLMV